MSHLREYIERNHSSESSRSSAMELLRRKMTCTELLLKQQQPEKSSLPDRGRKELIIPPFDALSSRRSSSRSSRDSSLRSVEDKKQQNPDSLEERQQLYLALQKRRKNSIVRQQLRPKSCVESLPTKVPLPPQKSKSLDPNLFGDDSSRELFRELRDKGVSENEAAARQRRFTSLKKVIGYFEDDL